MRKIAAILIIVILLLPNCATAQNVAFDPTTYGPAIAYYLSARADWRSSQRFFARGYVEHNAKFTITGLPDSAPISYSQGMFKIERDTALLFGLSAVHNAASDIMFTDHEKFGKFERVAFCVGFGYYMSYKHVRQAQRNDRVEF